MLNWNLSSQRSDNFVNINWNTNTTGFNVNTQCRFANKHSVKILFKIDIIALFFYTDVYGLVMCDLSGARTVSKAYAQHPAHCSPAKTGRQAFGEFSCHSARLTFSQGLTVCGAQRKTYDKDTRSGGSPVINRSTTLVSTPAKKNKMRDPKDNTGANYHMWAIDTVYISKFSSQSQRHEQKSSQDLISISRRNCSWQRSGLSPCQNDQTIV